MILRGKERRDPNQESETRDERPETRDQRPLKAQAKAAADLQAAGFDIRGASG